MTDEEAKKMLEAKLKCFIAETSGTNHDCNMRLCDGCALNYEQGNMGEQKEALDMAIKALEQQRWIPVSERLPKENEYIGNVCKYYLIQDEYGDMHVAHLSNVGWIPMNSLKAIGDEIIAWRELPERYKAESEGKE